MTDYEDEQPASKLTFERWLLTQSERGDWVDGIAEAGRADRSVGARSEAN